MVNFFTKWSETRFDHNINMSLFCQSACLAFECKKSVSVCWKRQHSYRNATGPWNRKIWKLFKQNGANFCTPKRKLRNENQYKTAWISERKIVAFRFFRLYLKSTRGGEQWLTASRVTGSAPRNMNLKCARLSQRELTLAGRKGTSTKTYVEKKTFKSQRAVKCIGRFSVLIVVSEVFFSNRFHFVF